MTDKLIIPGEPENSVPPTQTSLRDLRSLIGLSQIGLFVLAATYAVYHAKPVLLPLVLALLLTMILKPIHRTLTRLRMPPALAAALVVITLLGAIYTTGDRLATPATEWLETIDMENAEARLAERFAPIQQVQKDLEEVVKKVDNIAEGTPRDDSTESNDSTGLDTNETRRDEIEVTIGAEHSDVAVPDKQNGEIELQTDEVPVAVEISDRPVNRLLDYFQDFGVHLVATLLLIFFFLGFGETMHRRLAEDDATAELAKGLSRDISAYLFTITGINVGLGICIGICMWILNMPNPVLWGVMGGILNYVPYVGAIAGAMVVFIVATVSLDDTTMVLFVPAVYFGLTAIEGNVITPMIIGKRFTLNPIVVAIWFMSWGALWGVPGMLIATPTLMAFKIVCANVPGMARLDRIMSV